MKADMVTPYVGRFVLVIIDAEFVVQGALESAMNDKSQRRIAADTARYNLREHSDENLRCKVSVAKIRQVSPSVLSIS